MLQIVVEVDGTVCDADAAAGEREQSSVTKILCD